MARGRPRSSIRPFVEDAACIDIANAPPAPDPISELEDFPPFGESPFAPQFIQVTAQWAGGDKTTEEIRLTKTKLVSGGERRWYLCPHCHRRCARLHAFEQYRHFTCRVCLGLVYKSQYRKSPLDRAVRRFVSWRDGSEEDHRRWAKRFVRALETGRINWDEGWEILNLRGDLPKGI
jgi:hypothetical protein